MSGPFSGGSDRRDDGEEHFPFAAAQETSRRAAPEAGCELRPAQSASPEPEAREDLEATRAAGRDSHRALAGEDAVPTSQSPRAGTPETSAYCPARGDSSHETPLSPSSV